jgi:hypothetical protein
MPDQSLGCPQPPRSRDIRSSVSRRGAFRFRDRRDEELEALDRRDYAIAGDLALDLLSFIKVKERALASSSASRSPEIVPSAG